MILSRVQLNKELGHGLVPLSALSLIKLIACRTVLESPSKLTGLPCL